MTRRTKWLGIVALLATGACKPPVPATDPNPGPSPGPQQVTSIPAEFALVARVPASESAALEALLAKQVLPSLGRSRRVRAVSTYAAREGGAVLYVVQVTLARAGPQSPNLAFELLADGRSFEDARAVQADVRRYFRTAPIVAEHRADLSVQRSSALQAAKEQKGGGR